MIDSDYYEAQCYIRGTSLAATYRYQNAVKSGYTYYVQNAHGDVVNLTDAEGAVTKTYRYDAFGVELSPVIGDVNVFRYCGEYFDTETGTVYLRARYYQASIGRFTQRDTAAGKLGDPLSLNLYTYCHNNPIFYFDPSGHRAYGKGQNGTGGSGHYRGRNNHNNKFEEFKHTMSTATGVMLNDCKESVSRHHTIIKNKIKTWTDTNIKPFVKEQLITHRSGLESMKQWMGENDRTWSVGNSFTFGGGHSAISISHCYTYDTNGYLASQCSWNLGATSDEVSLSYGYYYCVTNAPSYSNLNGNGYSFGGGALAPVYGPIGVGAGVDFVAIPDADDQRFEYGGIMGSLLIGMPGKEIHGQTGMTYTTWSSDLEWLSDAYNDFYKRAMAWAES